MITTVTVHSTREGRVEFALYIDERHLGVEGVRTEKIDRSALALDASDAQILFAAEAGLFKPIDDGNGEWSSDLTSMLLGVGRLRAAIDAARTSSGG